MILPDVNLLVYAYNSDAPGHSLAKVWWENLLNGTRPVALSWIVLLGFLRLMTNPRVLKRPLKAPAAILAIRAWLACPNVQIVEPGPRHLELIESLLEQGTITANLTTDAHLAALAIEHRCEVHSNDADFSRFVGLRWSNPLRPKS